MERLCTLYNVNFDLKYVYMMHCISIKDQRIVGSNLNKYRFVAIFKITVQMIVQKNK